MRQRDWYEVAGPQRALNAAACVVTGTRKFDRGLGQILHDQLHWLDVPRPGSLRASSDSSPVSERPRTTVSVGALHPGLQC